MRTPINPPPAVFETRISRLAGRGAAGCVAALLVSGGLAGVASAGPADCGDPAAPVTAEEQRLTQAVPQQILRRSGFSGFAPRFARALCGAGSFRAAHALAGRDGRRLWSAAIARVQGRGPAGGDLSRDDDRPLYWARLGMTGALARWRPAFPLSARQRADLVAGLERSSRGQDTIRFPPGERTSRIVVTGFDPFQLDADIRRSNPSGAAVLALDGRTLRTASGPARVETATFPVRWRDFADGMVERALLPSLARGRDRIDMFTTVSQGRPDRFDIERFNGAWRGGALDNQRASSTGTIPIPAGVPTVRPQPQWTSTTLPHRAIVEAATGRFPVIDNTAVTEIPAGQTEPVVRPDGPTPGSQARAGAGGNFLSNEIAYRATLLRDALRLRTTGGHVHTPVLQFAAGNTAEITDPVFLRNRHDITAQTHAIIVVAAGTLGGS